MDWVSGKMGHKIFNAGGIVWSQGDTVQWLQRSRAQPTTPASLSQK